jgi:DNA polymerase-1
VDGLKTAQAEADAIIKAATADLKAMAGYDLNPDSPKQLCDFFYNRKGEKAYVNRKTGNPTTDEKALKRLARKGYEEANVILQIRHYSKLKGTYLDVTLDTDNRLRCAFNPAGTKNGRLSSSETIFGTGTNLQNLPEEFRKYVIADDNCLFFNVDLSQAENRIVAYTAPEPAMIAAFERKVDVHSQTGALISGLPMEEVKRQDKEDVKCNLGGGLYTWRFWGKKANHGLNYDLGYKTFAFYYEIPEQDAKYIVDRYHMAYPGIRQYHAWVRAKLSKDRTLTNPLGRSRMFADRWGDELFKEAYNFIPQSTVADIINRWGLNYIYYNQHIFKPVDLLLQVHDSILFQMDYTKWSWVQQAEVLLALKRSLEKEIVWAGRSFVIPAEFMCGTNFSKNSMKKVTITDETTVERLAEQLSGIYGELRASV